MCRILFITYDGPTTSYLTGLFLPILTGLSRSGYRPHVLQFTWGADGKIDETKRICVAQGVPYRAIQVWRFGGGLGPLLTAATGGLAIRRAVRDWKIDILMPRSLMPAIAVFFMRPRREQRIVFDADGFAADERADFQGLSRNSLTYRTLKWVERRMVRVASSVMVRTKRAADMLRADSGADVTKFFVVTNGRDPSAYAGERPLRLDNSLRLCYAGSIGAQYLPDQMFELARSLREAVPETTLQVFTGDTERARSALEHAGLAGVEWIAISQVQPWDIPSALKSCDIALALRKNCYSSQGLAPIKIGEYLMAGLPIIGTAGIGEVVPAIEAGVMFPFDGDRIAAVEWVIEEFLPDRVYHAHEARRVGMELFGIERSIRGYEAALEYARQVGAR